VVLPETWPQRIDLTSPHLSAVITQTLLYILLFLSSEHAVAQLVEALCYEPEGACSIPDEVIGFFN
jgi:hypothetical protein